METVGPGLTVLCCRGDATADPGSAVGYDDPAVTALGAGAGAVLAACQGLPIHLVGPRPKKRIDPLLAGRVLVVGDDADLNAVVLRLLRKDLLGSVQVCYAAVAPSAIAERYRLGVGAQAAVGALSPAARVAPAPLARHDSGGVLVGRAVLAPLTGTFYVDARRVPGGTPAEVTVMPDAAAGLAVTVRRRRLLGSRRQEYAGRAVEFGIVPGSGTVITYDGITHPREVKQWVFYRHADPLLLVRP